MGEEGNVAATEPVMTTMMMGEESIGNVQHDSVTSWAIGEESAASSVAPAAGGMFSTMAMGEESTDAPAAAEPAGGMFAQWLWAKNQL